MASLGSALSSNNVYQAIESHIHMVSRIESIAVRAA